MIASYKGDVGIGETLPKALANALGTEITDDPVVDPPPGSGGPDGPDEPNGGGEQTLDEQITSLLTRAEKAFTDADAAQRAGDTVRWAELMEQGRDLVAKALAKVDEKEAQEEKNPAAE